MFRHIRNRSRDGLALHDCENLVKNIAGGRIRPIQKYRKPIPQQQIAGIG
jgi:hypothetical protein